MIVRGGFADLDHDPNRTVVMIGNVGGTIWPRFRSEEEPGPDPLDAWTRSVLQPIAASFGAEFVHPSDRPFQPFQRWAQRADDVWSSPIGLLIHSEFGLWHAYRGALLFAEPVAGLPSTGHLRSPCLDCADQPCLTTCPVDAFTPDGYDAVSCAGHVRSDAEPDCLHGGCAARCACPVGVSFRYETDQMEFHMRAFIGE